MKGKVAQELPALSILIDFWLKALFEGLFVCLDALRPSQQIFRQVGTISYLPVLNQLVLSSG